VNQIALTTQNIYFLYLNRLVYLVISHLNNIYLATIIESICQKLVEIHFFLRNQNSLPNKYENINIYSFISQMYFILTFLIF